MALWLVRTGSNGEHEEKFISDNRIYLTWEGVDEDLGKFQGSDQFREVQARHYPEQSAGTVGNYAAQMRSFVERMQQGDLVAVPSKQKSSISFGEIVGPYKFDKNATDPYWHYRDIKWLKQDVPRSQFDQDLLYSLGAFSTVCEIHRNDAEKRIRAMLKTGFKPSAAATKDEDLAAETSVDLEQAADDEIAKLILRKFKGHGLERLVAAILRAQGYTTHESPPGPDKGVDILAAPGPLGFGHPRICVQVKSTNDPVDLPTLNQLVGAMHNTKADQGLLVSWGGFKATVTKEVPNQFFQVRLWTQRQLIEELQANYDKLDAEVRAEIPLKQIWIVAGDS